MSCLHFVDTQRNGSLFRSFRRVIIIFFLEPCVDMDVSEDT